MATAPFRYWKIRSIYRFACAIFGRDDLYGIERLTQQELFETLSQICPEFSKIRDLGLLPAKQNNEQIFGVHSMLGLRILELALYFPQSKERISGASTPGTISLAKRKRRPTIVTG